jgi:hypothetical protein
MFHEMFIIVILIFFNCNIINGSEKEIDYDNILKSIENAKEGDTVNIPEGKLVLKKGIIVKKNLTIKGAGIGKTIIESCMNNENETALTVIGKDLDKFPIHITGISFEGLTKDKTNKSISMAINGSCKKFRIDNCKFTGGGWYAIFIWGDTYGVIDDCQFIDPPKENIFVGNNKKGDTIPGNASWNNKPWAAYNFDLDVKPNLGTTNAVYVEDCDFEFKTVGDNAICSNHGGRYVFRYNKISSEAKLNSCQIDAHGNWNSGSRGTLFVEIYGNSFYSGHSYYGIHIRGGAGVIYNNTFYGDYTRLIALNNYRVWNKSNTWKPSGTMNDDKINNIYIWGNIYNNNSYNKAWIYPGVNLVKGADFYEDKQYIYKQLEYPHPLRSQIQ